VLQHFFGHVPEVAAFRHVAVVVSAFVMEFFHRLAEPGLGQINVLPNLRQVREPERRPKPLDQVAHGDAMEGQLPVRVDVEFLLRPVKGLLNEVDVFVFHFTKNVRKCKRKTKTTKVFLFG
jgi:hypothetical protein